MWFENKFVSLPFNASVFSCKLFKTQWIRLLPQKSDDYRWQSAYEHFPYQMQPTTNTSKLASKTIRMNCGELNPMKTFCEWRCKALIVGGGTGGCAIGAKLSSEFGKNECIILEPASQHYYQPMFTMIGGGIKTLENSRRSMESVLPRKAKWIKDAAAKFNPSSNEVITSGGHTIAYDFLVIAIGLQLNYSKVSVHKEEVVKRDAINFFSIISTDSRFGGSPFDSKRKCYFNLFAKICWQAFECA